MEALRDAVKACQSGAALVKALEGAGVTGGPIPVLIADCMHERTGAAASAAPAAAPPANGAATAALAAAPLPLGERAAVDNALCVIDGLMFVSPRCDESRLKTLLACERATAARVLPVGPTRTLPAWHRGKQQLALFKDCLMVKTAKADLAVPWNAIRHVAVSGQQVMGAWRCPWLPSRACQPAAARRTVLAGRPRKALP